MMDYLYNLAVGVDIEETERFTKHLEDESFLEKIFSKEELRYCMQKKNPSPHLAARFAVKEAAIKAFSQMGYEITFKDIILKKDSENRPYIVVEKHADIEVKASISHTREYAVAFLLATRN